MNTELESLKRMLDEQKYIYDEELAVTLFVALKLERPLLIEGAAGVGKTEVAKAMSGALGRELVRLQCYEGIDETKALYEWNYQKQLLTIQVNMGACERDPSEMTSSLFGEEYLLERPLLKSIRSAEPVVLLIDEIDKADEEFEAFLLELLSDFQVSIPELGTIKARTSPFVVLTSNNTRPLSDALKRRCAYLYIDYPTVEKEVRIIHARLPGIDTSLAVQVAEAVKYLRNSDTVVKKPSVAETLDWISALTTLGIKSLDERAAESTIGFVLKNNDDIEGILNDENFRRSLH